MSTTVRFLSKSRFRFERFWVKLEGFQEAMAASWTSIDAPEDLIRRLSFKLQKVAGDLQRWSSRRMGSIRDQLLVANEVIGKLDVAQESWQLSGLELSLRQGLKRRVLDLASLEQTIARQRARVVAMKDGDAALSLFRAFASNWQRRNQLTCLWSSDRIATTQEDMDDPATDFYIEVIGMP
jgi:hypothetical protein